MIRSSIWRCKCGKHGIGGPDGWKAHFETTHNTRQGFGSQVSFGFAPNYSNGWRTNHWSDYRPAPRCGDAQ